MADVFFGKAKEYIQDDELEKAIKYFLMSLNENHNIASAYELGTLYLDCYEDLGLTKQDAQNKAISYFQVGAINGHADCQKELSSLLLEKGDKKSTFQGLKWLLSSRKYEHEIKKIIKKLDDLYNGTYQDSENELKETIEYFKEIIKLTKNSSILTPSYKYKKRLIRTYAKLVINRATSLDDLKNKFQYFDEYINEDFFKESMDLYYTKEANIYLKTAQDVIEVKEHLKSIDSKRCECVGVKDAYCLWFARSYRDGSHNVKENIDTALKYYAKVQDAIAITEKDKMVSAYCKFLLERNDIEKLKIYVEFITEKNMRFEFDKKIEEIETFKQVEKKAQTGDKDALKKLADFHDHGIGTPQNKAKALEIYQRLDEMEQSKKSYNYIYSYYSNRVKEYISSANSIRDYQVVMTKNISNIDTYSKIIYYLYDYYKSEIAKQNLNYKENFDSFMAVKNENYDSRIHKLKFPGALYNFFNLFDKNQKWIICTAPGHEASSNITNGVFKVLQMVNLPLNFTKRNTIIQRKYSVARKATAGEERNFNVSVEMDSLAIEPKFDVTNKFIIVVDDITTTGCTLIACKNLLLKAGAKKVVLVALGKTKEYVYEY